MIRARACVLLVVLVLSLTALAQPTTLGSLPHASSGHVPSATPLTFVDISHAARANARVIGKALVGWTGGGCQNAFYVRVLRPPTTTLGTFSLVAERGPFSAVNGLNVVDLSPAFTVSANDVLAVAQVGGANCGGLAVSYNTDAGSALLQLSGDFKQGAATGGFAHGATMVMMASADGNVWTHTLPIVGATQGSFNSRFRTVLQASNPTAFTAKGRLVYRALNVAGTADDPSYAYSIPPFSTVLFPDTITMFGAGIGSVDVITNTSLPPIFTARVFNDNGSNGTAGLSEDAAPLDRALRAGEATTITLPEDIEHYRMNIGFRSLDAEAETRITVVYRAADSTPLAQLERSFPPNYLTQETIEKFTGSAAVPNGMVWLRVTQGSVFVYSTITDNRTNDSAYKLAPGH